MNEHEMKNRYGEWDRESSAIVFYPLDPHLLISVILLLILGVVLIGGGTSILIMSVKYWGPDTELSEKIMVPIISALLILWGSHYIVDFITAVKRQMLKNCGKLKLGLYFSKDAMMVRQSKDDISVIAKSNIVSVSYKINRSGASIGKYITIEITIKDEHANLTLFSFKNADFNTPVSGYFSDVVNEWRKISFGVFKSGIINIRQK